MLTRQEFLAVVLPPEGMYCVIGVTGKIVRSQTFHNTLSEVDAAVDLLDNQRISSYVALASFQDDRNRTAANATQLNSFFLDLDCDPSNPNKYIDQTAAVQDLKRFVKELKLPRPMLVNSGNGVHAYWPLTSALQRNVWKVIAEKFKDACLLYGLKIDPAVPADAARVLRAVLSSNHKDRDNPRKVEILNTVPPVDSAIFCNALGILPEMLEGVTAQQPLNDITKALLAKEFDKHPASFKLILRKSLAGDGCPQLLNAVEHQSTVSYDLWRDVLSIAQFCKDRDKAIHMASSEHPDYSFQETEIKAADIAAPHFCVTFERNNPKGCDGCKHKGKINTPIVLGRGEVDKATDNVVADVQDPAKSYEIPDFPFPFFRSKTGGVWVKGKDKEGNPKDEEIYANDFYMVHTVDDPHHGMSALFRLHLPQDGVKEFLLPMREITAKDTFAKRVAEQGIGIFGKKMESLMIYTNMAINQYQKTKRAEKSRVQFGWADHNTSFIVGDRQITATEVRYSPPSSETLGLIKIFSKKGTIEGWKRIASFYNRPGMEMHMFALFAAFGSPLVPFSSKKGGIISLYSSATGTGKTTMLQMINSVFGHPEDSMLIKSDTAYARIHRIGTMQNITPTVDEITNESPEATSEFLYSYLHARGRHRLHNNANKERLNTTTWNSNCVVTGNAPIEDKLYTKKRTPDGELARLLEFNWVAGNTVNKIESDAIFNDLKNHYGVAGEMYIQYVIREMSPVIKLLDDMQLSVDTNAGLTQQQRYWSNIAVTSLTGGLVSRSAGVMDYTDNDFERIYKWTISMLSAKRKASIKTTSEPSLMLGAFLSEHVNDMLVIKGISKGSQEAPIREPRGKLYVRYEPDSKLLYINKTKFREFCIGSQVSYNNVMDCMMKMGVFVEEKKVRMGRGMAVSQPDMALIFTNQNDALFDEEFIDGNPRDTNHD
jgi:hypothetical protein